MADKVDLKRVEKAYFTAPDGYWDECKLPEYPFLMVDGRGSPGDGSEYQAALEALYPLAYAVKFHSKRALGRDYVVPPLEGLWWADDPEAFAAGRRDEWRWTMMLMLPRWIDADHVAEARGTKRGRDLSAVRMGRLAEGLALQRLHLGSFASEAPVLRALHHELMPSRGLAFNGHHHEIYLSDPRRCAPEKLRTILRQPISRS